MKYLGNLFLTVGMLYIIYKWWQYDLMISYAEGYLILFALWWVFIISNQIIK